MNELYADVFSKTYGMKTIGLRYFNVFGRKQAPKRVTVIPKFVMHFMCHDSPTINGDCSFSLDFTYADAGRGERLSAEGLSEEVHYEYGGALAAPDSAGAG